MKPFYDEGLHIGQIIEHRLTKASTGTVQLAIRVKILGLPDAQNPDSYAPHRAQYERTIFMAITEKTMPFVTESIKVMGFEGKKITELDMVDHPEFSMAGTQVDLWCKIEQDQQGNDRERWQISKGNRAMEVKPIDAKAGRQLDALFAKALKTGNFAPPKKGEQGPPPLKNIHGLEITDSDLPSMEDDDDSIPF